MPFMDQIGQQLTKPIKTDGMSSGVELAQQMHQRKQEMEMKAVELKHKQTELHNKKSQHFLDAAMKAFAEPDKFTREKSIDALEKVNENFGLGIPKDIFDGGRKSDPYREGFYQSLKDPEIQELIASGKAPEILEFISKGAAQGVPPKEVIETLKAAQANQNQEEKNKLAQERLDLSRERLEESITKSKTTYMGKITADFTKLAEKAEMASKDLELLNKKKVLVIDAHEAQAGIARLITGKNNIAFGMSKDLNFTPFESQLGNIYDKYIGGKEDTEIPPGEVKIIRERTMRLGASVLRFVEQQSEVAIKNGLTSHRINQDEAQEIRNTRNEALSQYSFYNYKGPVGKTPKGPDGLKGTSQSETVKRMSPDEKKKHRSMVETLLKDPKNASKIELLKKTFKEQTGEDY